MCVCVGGGGGAQTHLSPPPPFESGGGGLHHRIWTVFIELLRRPLRANRSRRLYPGTLSLFGILFIVRFITIQVDIILFLSCPLDCETE